MGARGHYLNPAVVSCQCGHYGGEEFAGKRCPECGTIASDTTNTALFKRPLAHKSLSADFTPSHKTTTKLIDALLDAEYHPDYIVRRMLAMEQYETLMGIHDYNTPVFSVATPLVRKNTATQIVPYSLYANEIRRLIKHKVPQKTGMGLVELLNMPTEMYRVTLLSCMAATAVDGEMVAELMEDLQ